MQVLPQVQTANEIIITITKDGVEGEEVPPTEGNETTVPTDPIIIIPPNNETGQNGTVIVPEPPVVANETGGNVTTPTEPPVIIIEPDGNSTTVEPPSNVTEIDNGTVIVHPPDQNVTETPGNVTVVDPPAPEPCGCPEAPPAVGDEQPTLPINETSSQPVQPPVTAADNTTIIVEPPVLPPVEEGDGGGEGGGNGNGEGNEGGG